MSIALDGFKVLRRLGKNAEAFRTIRADVDKAARTLVVKSLKAKSTGLDGARDIHKALGDTEFGLLVDGLKDTEVKTLLTRLDKHLAGAKTMSSPDRKQHFLALTSGSIEPSLPAAKAQKAKKSAPKKTPPEKPEPKRLQSDVMDLFKARGRGTGN